MTSLKFNAVTTLPDVIEKGKFYVTSDGSQYVGKSDNTVLKITDIQFLSYLPFTGIENKLYVIAQDETVKFYIWDGTKYVQNTYHASNLVQDENNRLVSDTQISSWDAKETVAGSISKSSMAEINAKEYTDAKIAEVKESAINIVTEKFTSTANQSVFFLDNSYLVGKNRLRVYVGGVRQYVDDNYTETGDTVITFNESLPSGIKVVVEIMK